MKIPAYARYDYCAQKACEFLEEFNVTSYPIDVEKIIYQKKWGLTPYSLLMKEFNCDREKVIRCLRSKDGYTQLDGTNYSIAYNDDPKLGNRKRFTLMHEVGHIYLNHLKDFDITLLYRGSLSKEENRVLENEANAFARNVLAPVTLVTQLKEKTPENISSKFGITPNAAHTRINLIELDKQHINTSGSLGRMLKIFKKFYNKTTCNRCHASFDIKYREFCPICGSSTTLQRGDGTMNYKIYETDSNGFLKTCIKCHNELLIGDFCHICGAPVKNFCSNHYNMENIYDACNHSEPLPSNARYCPDCGSESTFFRKKILSAWSIEYDDFLKQEEIEAHIPGSSNNNFSTLPDDIDEELPFN